MSLQIECLAPLILQNGHAASSSAASLSRSPSAAPSSSPSCWISPLPTLTCIHGEVGWGGFTLADTKDKLPLLSSGVDLLPELLSIHTLGVFTDFHQRLNAITPVAAEAVPLKMYLVLSFL